MERDSFGQILTDGKAVARAMLGNWKQNRWRVALLAAGLIFLAHGFISATESFRPTEAKPLLERYSVNREYLRSVDSVRDWGLAILLVTAAFLPIPRIRSFRPSRPQLKEAALLVLLLVAAFAWRYPGLTEYPPDVHGDEALCGNEAKKLDRAPGWHLFEFGQHSKPNFTYYLTGVFLKVFGEDLYGLRMASVIPGLVIILLIYVTGRLCWGSWAGLLAAALAVPWHPFVHYSRIGLNNIQATMFLAASITFLLAGITRRRSGLMLLAGLMGAFGIQTYQAAYIWPFLIIGFVIHGHLRNPWFLVRHGARFAALGLGVVLGVGLFAYANKGLVSGHVDEVNIFNREQIDIHAGIYETNSFLGILKGQFAASWSVFNDNPGTKDTQHGTRINFIDPWLYRVLLAGLLLSAVFFFDWRWFMIFWWFFLAVVLGNVLTIEVPWSPRLVAIFFPVPLLWAGVFETVRRALYRLPENLGPWLMAVPVTAVLLYSTWWNTEKYFGLYCRETHRAGNWTVIAKFLDDLPENHFVYWTGVPRIYFRYDTLLFLAPDAQGMNIINPGAQYPVEVQRRRDRDAWFVTYIGDQLLADIPRQIWPDGERQVIVNSHGAPIFDVYHVPAAHLDGHVATLSRNGLEATLYPSRDWTGNGRKELHKVVAFGAGHAYQYLGQNFSIEWNGYLRTGHDGRYELRLVMPHGGSGFIEIDGNRVVEAGDVAAPVELARGRHSIRIRYAPGIDIGRVLFVWRTPGGREEIVPIVNLEPPEVNADAQ